jgi:cytochrome c
MRRHGTALRLAAAAAVCLAAAGCQRQERQAPAVDGGDAAAGRALIRFYGCGSCHEIPGIPGARGTIGSPLTDWGARRMIAGELPNSPEYLIAWILDPQAIRPGTAMPTMGIEVAEARHMAAYLLSLGDEVPLGPPHPLSRRLLERFGPGARKSERH